MSSWTILTLRAKPGTEYEHADYDEPDRWYATADLVATVNDDRRIRAWTTWDGHVYAYLAADGFGNAEVILEGYGEMIDDAVVLEANNTVDLGSARYYPNPSTGRWTDHFDEIESDDGTHTGEVALAVMTARHGIIARDPFHNQCGTSNESYLEDGTARPINEEVKR